jgi:hypothetical protein
VQSAVSTKTSFMLWCRLLQSHDYRRALAPAPKHALSWGSNAGPVLCKKLPSVPAVDLDNCHPPEPTQADVLTRAPLHGPPAAAAAAWGRTQTQQGRRMHKQHKSWLQSQTSAGLLAEQLGESMDGCDLVASLPLQLKQQGCTVPACAKLASRQRCESHAARNTVLNQTLSGG